MLKFLKRWRERLREKYSENHAIPSAIEAARDDLDSSPFVTLESPEGQPWKRRLQVEKRREQFKHRQTMAAHQ